MGNKQFAPTGNPPVITDHNQYNPISYQLDPDREFYPPLDPYTDRRVKASQAEAKLNRSLPDITHSLEEIDPGKRLRANQEKALVAIHTAASNAKYAGQLAISMAQESNLGANTANMALANLERYVRGYLISRYWRWRIWRGM
jgi:hypothetical protein